MVRSRIGRRSHHSVLLQSVLDVQPGREKLLAPPPLFEGWGSDKQSTIGGLPKIDPPKPGREKVPVPPPPVKGFDGGAKNGETGGLAAILVIEADCQTLLITPR